VQLGVNKPSVISCAAQLLKVLGVDDLTEGSFMPPSTSAPSSVNLSLDPSHTGHFKLCPGSRLPISNSTMTLDKALGSTSQ